LIACGTEGTRRRPSTTESGGQEHVRLWYSSTLSQWSSGWLFDLANSRSPSPGGGGGGIPASHRCGRARRSASSALSLSLSHIRILRHARHKVTPCTEAARKATLLITITNNAKTTKVGVRPSYILCSARQTLTRSTHAYAELGKRQPASCIRTIICNKHWSHSTTARLHAHIVCACDQYVRARWARRWRWWRQASLPFLLGRKM